MDVALSRLTSVGCSLSHCCPNAHELLSGDQVTLSCLSVRLCSITSKGELGAGQRTKHIGATVTEPDSYVLSFFF